MPFRLGQPHDPLADPARIPPGQHVTERFPVLHAGSVQQIDPAGWQLTLTGLLERERAIGWEELLSLPAPQQLSDIHCVTRWSKLDTAWRGVRVADLLESYPPLPEARHVVVHAAGDWTTNLPLDQLLGEDVLVAYEYEGEPLTAEHGGPVRLIVPHLYFWKSAKWLTGIEFVAEERLGYWEQLGYHSLGDPWLEQRYAEPRVY